MNSIEKFSVNNICNDNYLVTKSQLSWDKIFRNKNLFYDEIAKSLLNEESLYFFCTSNNDSKILQRELNDIQKKRIKKIFEILIKSPEKFYNEYNKGEKLLKELGLINSYEELEEYISRYGFNYKLKKETIKKDKSNISKKIKKESSYGIFGEIMLYNVVQYLLNDKKLLLSKLSFITAPGTYSHGSDGLFINKDSKTIFYGEAKFTLDLKSSFEQALSSLKDISERINNDNNVIYCHESDLKNNYSLEIFEKKEIDEYDKCVIIFAFHGREYILQDINKIVRVYEDKFKKILGKNIKFEILVFPIINKEELKLQIAKQVSDNYESY